MSLTDWKEIWELWSYFKERGFLSFSFTSIPRCYGVMADPVEYRWLAVKRTTLEPKSHILVLWREVSREKILRDWTEDFAWIAQHREHRKRTWWSLKLRKCLKPDTIAANAWERRSWDESKEGTEKKIDLSKDRSFQKTLFLFYNSFFLNHEEAVELELRIYDSDAWFITLLRWTSGSLLELRYLIFKRSTFCSK